MRASEAAVSTATDVVSRLGADISAGLTAEEVERRRKAFGRNEFTIKEEEPLSKKYLNQVSSHGALTTSLPTFDPNVPRPVHECSSSSMLCRV